jgi:hypothetical protein
MRSFAPYGVLGFFAVAATCADAATITGTVMGPDGAPFRGAFVQARHAGLKMTVSVLTDNQGRYLAENLPEGDYRVQVRAVGFKTDAKTGVKLSADQNASFDFALATTPVKWTDISIYQGLALLPDARGKRMAGATASPSCGRRGAPRSRTARDFPTSRPKTSFLI